MTPMNQREGSDHRRTTACVMGDSGASCARVATAASFGRPSRRRRPLRWEFRDDPETASNAPLHGRARAREHLAVGTARRIRNLAKATQDINRRDRRSNDARDLWPIDTDRIAPSCRGAARFRQIRNSDTRPRSGAQVMRTARRGGVRGLLPDRAIGVIQATHPRVCGHLRASATVPLGAPAREIRTDAPKLQRDHAPRACRGACRHP